MLTGGQVLWGVGLDASTITASLQAVISVVNRAYSSGQPIGS